MQNAETTCELIPTDSPVQRGRRQDAHAPIAGKVLRQPVTGPHFVFHARFHSSEKYISPTCTQAGTVAEFVQERFIPEFVMKKGFAGRTHFRAILKHVLPPERVAVAFGKDPNSGRDKLTTVAGWPYLDHFHLREVTAEMIQELTAQAIAQGYSIQTVTHIRNVVRSIFSHAIRTGHYSGTNPAVKVTLPAPTRKTENILTFGQLADLMASMQCPEREMALFALLTGMNVGEICGLAWKHLNLSNMSRVVGSEVIPPRTIAVRIQSHRGTLSKVIDSRKRFIRVPRALEGCLTELRRRKNFVGLHDLVLVSRIGTPLHPENIAARRLKLIGDSFGIPWLTWSTFHRTRSYLSKQPGTDLHAEVEKMLQAGSPYQRIHLS